MTTPYDAEIAATRPENTRYLLMAKREGYLTAKAEPDPVKQALVDLNAYVQQTLIPNVRSVEGGQPILDKGWTLVSQAHAALALTEKEA